MKRTFLLFTLVLLTLSSCQRAPKTTPVYLDPSAPIEQRVEDALSRLTLEEKVGILHAQSKFSSCGVPRLGIPTLWTDDGPHGIRPEVFWDKWEQAGWTNDSCVAFPSLTCLASTWDVDLARLYGTAIGQEAKYRGKNVLLGPGVNIYRTPLGGRNFEYMGEDPYLSGEMAAGYVQGVQSNNVSVCVKHFCLNNEETHRHTVDVDLDDRALYEIYLPAFKKAIDKGGAWSVMGSYNLYRGQHVCHNQRLLNDILKGEWGFDGAVISDWGGCHDTDEAITNGLDLEFGTWTDGLTMGETNAYDSYFLANAYLEKLRSGEASTEVLDEKCRRVLRLMMRTSLSGNASTGSMCSEEHYEVARKIVGQGAVLLKNDDNVLPVSSQVKKIAVIGENAIKMMTVGGGSSSLKAQKEISPLEGIRRRAEKEGIDISYARGYLGSASNSYSGVSTGQDLSDERSFEDILSEAVETARHADLVLFFGGLNKDRHQDSESADRESMSLPYRQDEVISALAEANPHIAVCLVSGNAVSMPWIDEVPSILQVWYGGSEAGEGIADVVFGDQNPCGKLPFTFPVALEDGPAHQSGTTFPNDGKTFYEEGIYVGYRWYESKLIKPLFAFGHGLSYTKFEYGKAKLSKKSIREGGKLVASIPVTNVGAREGAEVVQLYISDPLCSVDRPEKELKGFTKLFLAPGETATASIEIPYDALTFYDDSSKSFIAEKGEFVAKIGASSDDIRDSVSFVLK